MSIPHALLRASTLEVDYPESDGQPMAETELHFDETVDLLTRLRDRYAADPQVYVAGDMFVYYHEGDASAAVASDVFVVFGVPKVRRRIFKIWEEGAVPAAVFEVTSRKTRAEDRRKRALYAQIGVSEYVIYDPEGEYVRPPLQGYRLQGNAYDPIQPDGRGAIRLERLDLDVRIEEDGLIELYDARSGERLPRREEQIEAERQRADELADEVARLREALGRDGR